MTSPYDSIKIGQNIIEFLSLDSTNEYAIELVSKSKPSEGTVVFTYNQTAGRGQFGRKWISSPFQNLTLSVILKPVFLKASMQFDLNIVTSISVAELLEELTDEAIMLKWPNDVYLNDKKIAGILLQNTFVGSKFNYAVIGVGLNVNQKSFDSNLPNPTSLLLETKVDYDILAVRSRFFSILSKNYNRLRYGQIEEMRKAYHFRLYQRGVEIPYIVGQKTFIGKIKGVENTGKIIIQTQDSIQSYKHGEITFLKPKK